MMKNVTTAKMIKNVQIEKHQNAQNGEIENDQN